MADQQYDNTNRGAIFPQDKRKSTSPDYNGKLDVNGTEYWLSGWIKKGRNGEFLSLSLGEPVQQRSNESGASTNSTPRTLQRGTSSGSGEGRPAQDSQRRPQQSPNRDFEDMDDDIPF